MYIPLGVINYVDVRKERYIKKYDAQLNLVDQFRVNGEKIALKQSAIDGKTVICMVGIFSSFQAYNMSMVSVTVKGNYYLVTQDEQKPRNDYYVLKINMKDGTVETRTHLFALSRNKKDKTLKIDDFHIAVSPDSSKVLFSASYQRDKSSKTGVAYSAAAFTSDLQPLFSANYKLPKSGKDFKVKDAQITNDGEVLVMGRNLDKNHRDESGYVSVFAMSKEQPKPKETRMKFKGSYVNDVLLSLNNTEVPMAVGFYRNGSGKKGYDGMFYAPLDQDHQIYEMHKHEFDAEFIGATYSPNAEKKLKKKESRGKDLKESSRFNLTDFIKTDDGGYLAVAENYYVVAVTRTSGGGRTGMTTTHTEYHHHYGDMIVFKFDKDGKKTAMNKVAKENIYVTGDNSQPYERDYASSNIDGDTYLLFNDDAGLETTNRVRSGKNSRKTTYIAKVKQDGGIKKDLLISKDDGDGYVFDPHLNIQRAGANSLVILMSRRGRNNKRTRMGTVTIQKTS
ncbi:MAG: hypothetical protein QM743_09940 [Chitinophagaceae bacterium]